jgi:hypothetical protein
MTIRKLSRAWSDLVDDMREAAFNDQADVSLLSSEELEGAPKMVDLDEALDIANKHLVQAAMGPIWRLRTRAPFSRPCYDKPHRCPGWAGGGWLRALVSRCESGSLGRIDYRRRYWLGARCPECGLYVIPIWTRGVDPTWIWWRIRHPRWPNWAWRVEPRHLRFRWKAWRSR